MKNSGGNAKGSHSGEAWAREIQHVTEGQMRRGGKGAMGERCRAAHSGGALGQTRGRRGGPWQHSGLCLHLRGRAEEAGQGRWRRQLGRAAGSNIRWRGEQTVPFVQCPCACPLTPLLIMLLITHLAPCCSVLGQSLGICVSSQDRLTLSKVRGQPQAVSAVRLAGCHTLGVSRAQPEHPTWTRVIREVVVGTTRGLWRREWARKDRGDGG